MSSIRGRAVKRASLKNFPYRDARKVTLQGGEDAFLSHRRRPPIAAHPKNCRKGKLDGDDVGRGEKQGAPNRKSARASNIPAVASGGTSAVATATPTSATPTRGNAPSLFNRPFRGQKDLTLQRERHVFEAVN